MTASNKIRMVPMQSISLPASIDSLRQINKVLGSMLTEDFADYVFKTQLVVEELLANVCSYAYDDKNGTACLACGVVNFDGQEAIMIQLTDHGKPYDPFANATAPDLDASVEKRSIGGLGVHLVKEIASHYAYMRINECNQTQIILNVLPH